MRSLIKFAVIIPVVLLAASGCDKGVKGRAETVNIQALDAVGQNGTAARGALDRVLDSTDKYNIELERELK